MQATKGETKGSERWLVPGSRSPRSSDCLNGSATRPHLARRSCSQPTRFRSGCRSPLPFHEGPHPTAGTESAPRAREPELDHILHRPPPAAKGPSGLPTRCSVPSTTAPPVQTGSRSGRARPGLEPFWHANVHHDINILGSLTTGSFSPNLGRFAFLSDRPNLPCRSTGRAWSQPFTELGGHWWKL